MSDLISTKAVIRDLNDMAVEDDFCLDWLFYEREGHDLRIEVSPRLQEGRNLQGLQSVDELAGMTSPKLRVSEVPKNIDLEKMCSRTIVEILKTGSHSKDLKKRRILFFSQS